MGVAVNNLVLAGQETKLNLFGKLLHEECSGKYGEVTVRKAARRMKGRREKEVDYLVSSRRQRHRCWRKAEELEKGLKALWDEKTWRRACRVAAVVEEKKRKGESSSGILSDSYVGSLKRKTMECWRLSRSGGTHPWQRAMAVFISKEQNSKSIVLLNAECKIFFSSEREE